MQIDNATCCLTTRLTKPDLAHLFKDNYAGAVLRVGVRGEARKPVCGRAVQERQHGDHLRRRLQREAGGLGPGPRPEQRGRCRHDPAGRALALCQASAFKG